jgi:hypothetical protein
VYTFHLSLISTLYVHTGNMSDTGTCIALTTLNPLREAEINQLKMPVSVNEYVFWLQISVRNPFSLMQIFQDDNDLSGIELRGGFIEPSCPSKIAEDLAARAVV